MNTAFIQIKEQGKDWEDTPAKSLPYNEWKEVSKFAYQLSILYNTEIRVTDVHPNNNGHYYHYSNALGYLRA